MKLVRLFLLVFSLCWCFTFGFSQTPANDLHWEFVWGDEFNGTTLNTNIWYIMDNYDHGGNERQVHIDDNVSLSNGNLEIIIKNEVYSCPSWAINPNYFCIRQYNLGQPYQYTSGCIQSMPANNIKYGYMEARMKVDYGYGLWPAFWTFVGDTLINGIPSPLQGISNAAEIDIAELVGSLGPNILPSNIHKVFPDGGVYGLDLVPNGYHWSSWHIYAVEWSPEKIIWYLDGNIVRIILNHGIVDSVKLIFGMGLELGADISSLSFPKKMYVDYTRVYKYRKDCSTSLNLCSYWFPNHDNKVKKKITIGNGSCTNSVLSGQNIKLRASEEILINGNFEVIFGGELYMDVNSCY